ncbi:unnamed protein product [Allacma fusca]|uniref:Reverse transcriptase Ty1/copia-type domain-containing protein n=1 Tax=Allacma fusca TaxID=39272 RepID=A0A8J2NTL9_9HEXA|nr:unnamed protein product [Allacma fusca]
MDFHPLNTDPCLYQKINGASPIYLTVYVDDGIIMGRDQSELAKVLDQLKESFKLTVQPFEKFLGVDIIHTRQGIFIHQQTYIEELLRRFDMSECKTLDIPMQPGLQLQAAKSCDTRFQFQELIGALLFIARCTRPDIAYPVHYLARFFAGYEKYHWEAAKKILRETTKRKAPPSTSTDPKRPCLLWTLAILWFLIDLSGATSTSPIIWRKSLKPVIVGFNAFTMKLQLISPCSLLPAEGIEVQIYRKMTKECEDKYEELFRKQLEKICPKDKITFGRQKRFVFTAGFIVIVAVVSAGVGLAGYAVSRTYALETKQEELKQALDQLEQDVYTSNKRLKLLQMEVRKITSQLDQLVMEVDIFKLKTMELHYVISYLMGNLLEGKRIIRDTGKSWSKKELTSDLFEFLNITLPCTEDCPIEFGIFNKCTMGSERTDVTLEFSVPTVNRSLLQVKADPFDLRLVRGNETCRLVYKGPTLATVSTLEDCV